MDTILSATNILERSTKTNTDGSMNIQANIQADVLDYTPQYEYQQGGKQNLAVDPDGNL